MIIEKDELGIYDIEEFYTQLISQFDNGSVLLDLGNVHKIDMSTIQLLVSAKKSCKEASKTFKLQNVNIEVLDILKKASCGFLTGDVNE